MTRSRTVEQSGLRQRKTRRIQNAKHSTGTAVEVESAPAPAAAAVEVKSSDVTSDAYEVIRQQKIAANKKLLEQLGLDQQKKSLATVGSVASVRRINRPVGPRKYRNSKTAGVPLTATKRSRRIRGEDPSNWAEIRNELESEARKEGGDDAEVEEVERGSYSRNLWMGKSYFWDPPKKVPDSIGVPLTLTSIGTTVWDLGRIPDEEIRKKYWSSHQCLFHHVYPIGYRATKNHFGRKYTMEILEHKDGPVFVVTDDNGNAYQGWTPTQPWTQACLKSSSPGTRVSGPLFYGFSDPLTIHMIDQMVAEVDGTTSDSESDEE